MGESEREAGALHAPDFYTAAPLAIAPQPVIPELATTSITESIPAPVDQNKAAAIPYSIWTKKEKWAIVVLISLAGGLSPVTANIFYPAIPAIATNLRVTVEQLNLTVTWYTIVQGITPSIWGAICDVVGRRPVFIGTFAIYAAASIGLALTDYYWLLILLRCLQAAGSGSSVAIGAGAIGDLSPPSERGGFMGVFSMGLVIGPCIGPVVGGLLSQAFGWHAIFWFTAAFGGALALGLAVFLPETLRSLVGNGSIPARGINRTLLSIFRSRNRTLPPSSLVSTTLPPKTRWRDVKLLTSLKMFREKDVLLTLTFSSVVWTLFTSVVTSTSSSLKATYGLSEQNIGFCFLSLGGGCWLAAAINGGRLDRDYRVVAAQVRSARGEEESGKEAAKKDENDLLSFPIEHARLRSSPIFFPILLAATITYGWALQKEIHLAVPLICQFLIGMGVFSMFNTVSTLLVDLFPTQAGSATAANNLYRCLLGAVGTAVVEPLINALGPGWAFTLLAGIVVLFMPLLWLEWRYGMSFREERGRRMEREREEEEARKEENEEVKVEF